MTAQARAAKRWRGGPLVMLALLVTGWSAGRAVLWENPFAALASSLDIPALALPLAGPLVLPALPDVLAVSGPAAPAPLLLRT